MSPHPGAYSGASHTYPDRRYAALGLGLEAIRCSLSTSAETRQFCIRPRMDRIFYD